MKPLEREFSHSGRRIKAFRQQQTGLTPAGKVEVQARLTSQGAVLDHLNWGAGFQSLYEMLELWQNGKTMTFPSHTHKTTLSLKSVDY